MPTYFDELETRPTDVRAAAQLTALTALIPVVRRTPGACLPDVEINSLSDLADFPVLRKSDLSNWQKEHPPLGGMYTSNVTHVFLSLIHI